MSDYLKILIPSTVGLISTIVAAYFSARYGAKRALEQKWWERQERAYTDIIEALHAMIRYSDLSAQGYLNGSARQHPKEDEFRESYNQAYWNIMKATDIGAFAISEKAAEALTNLRKRPRPDINEEPPWEIFEEDSKAYRDTLNVIRSCARSDLNF